MLNDNTMIKMNFNIVERDCSGDMVVGKFSAKITAYNACKKFLGCDYFEDKEEVKEFMVDAGSAFAEQNEQMIKEIFDLSPSFSGDYVLEYKKCKVLKNMSEKTAEKNIALLNEILEDSGFTVEFNCAGEVFENEEDDDDPYNGKPMYEVYLNDEDEDQVDATGRYCCIDAVMSDLVELLAEEGLIKESSEIYQELKLF